MKKMNTTGLLLSLIAIFLSGCVTAPSITGSENGATRQSLPEYVAISPISLPPIAANIKTELQEIARNIDGSKTIPYDIDLLVLPTTLSKVQYRFFSLDSSGSASVASVSGSNKRQRSIYDLMHMASHPLPVVLKPKESPQKDVTIMVTLFVGVGVRVVAEYELDNAKGALSLPALAAELQANKGSGTIEIQQIGISRYGANNQGVTRIDLTPTNIETALKSIGYMMGQVWLADTRLQPMIVGYSVPGYTSIDASYHPYIVDQLLNRKDEILQPFVESMYFEAQEALGIPKNPKGKPGDTTDYSGKLEDIRKTVQKGRVIANTYSEVALSNPERLSEINQSIIQQAITDENTSPQEAKIKILNILQNRRTKP